MIDVLLLAGSLALSAPQAPPMAEGDPFATPKFLTMTFEEALKAPAFRAPERLPMDLSPLQRPASHTWLRLALGALANDSFERWERDPGGVRRTLGQPSWAWTRLNAIQP